MKLITKENCKLIKVHRILGDNKNNHIARRDAYAISYLAIFGVFIECGMYFSIAHEQRSGLCRHHHRFIYLVIPRSPDNLSA